MPSSTTRKLCSPLRRSSSVSTSAYCLLLVTAITPWWVLVLAARSSSSRGRKRTCTPLARQVVDDALHALVVALARNAHVIEAAGAGFQRLADRMNPEDNNHAITSVRQALTCGGRRIGACLWVGLSEFFLLHWRSRAIYTRACKIRSGARMSISARNCR